MNEKEILVGNWWVLLLRGLFTLLFGFVAIAWPGLTLGVLVLAFALYILVEGVIDIFVGFTKIGKGGMWVLLFFMGLLQIAVGIFALKNPAISLAAVVLLIGFTFIVRGILEVVAAFDSSFSGSQRALYGIIGVLGVIVGFAVLKYPVAGSLIWVWVLGFYSLFAGPVLMAMAFELKHHLDTAKA